MIQSKKIKLFLTAIIISVVMTLLPLQTEAKDKIYLNRTKITLNVGQTKKLSLIRNKKNVKKKIKKKIKLADPESFNEDYIYAVTDISFFGTQKELLEEEKKMKELSKEFYIYEQNRRKMREKRESRK